MPMVAGLFMSNNLFSPPITAKKWAGKMARVAAAAGGRRHSRKEIQAYRLKAGGLVGVRGGKKVSVGLRRYRATTTVRYAHL